MTTVSIQKNNDHITYIKISGHSGYAAEGSDIVCSAVSTACYVSIGLLDKYHIPYSFKEDEKTATMEIIINEYNNDSDKILFNLVDTFEYIASNYKQYFKIN